MALFTGKGDDGTTSLFGIDGRISKTSQRVELLGSLDEANTLIGLCRVKARSFEFKTGGGALADTLASVQQDLFIIQAIVAGSPKDLDISRIQRVEAVISDIEAELPLIKTFFLPGGTELSSLLDYARAVVRRVERLTVAVIEKEHLSLQEVLRYLNRLSSLLYALVRFVNYKQGVKETPPSY